MIPDSHAEAYLSEAYVKAVVTQAGFTCCFHDPDYGIDALASEIQVTRKGKCVPTGHHFSIQIKASYEFTRNDGTIKYELKADAYNKLTQHPGGLIVLVLFCLPQDPSERLFLTEDYLQLRYCSYWYRVLGDPTENKSSKTIDIPRGQVFDVAACQLFMEQVKSGEWKT